MILDPILRFNWIFYAIYSSELQHSALLSFFVGFSEVCRRGMWTLFRVENEHCTNVGRFRASRDVPLPYEITPPTPPSPEEPSVHGPVEGQTAPSPAWYSPTQVATTSNLEAQPSAGSSLRRRGAVPHNTPIQRGIARVGTMMGEAHAQDFERKRRPGTSVPASPYQHGRAGAGAESSDEEEEEDDEEVVDPEQDDDGAGTGAAQEEDEIDNARDVQSAENIMRRHRDSDA